MNTPEQQASEMLVLGVALSEKDMQALHDWAIKLRQPIIAERDALKAELAAIKGAGEPVAWGQLGMLNGKTYLRENWDRSPYPPPPSIVKNLNLVPLYTRPCVPLTDKQIFASEEIRAANAEIGLLFSSLLKLVRAIEAAHNIKGVKE